MRHFDNKHQMHVLTPTRMQYEWIEITYKHGAGRVAEGPYFTRAEEELSQEMVSFIMDGLQRPSPFSK